MEKQFTMADAIVIQNEQIADWAIICKPWVIAKLRAKCDRMNEVTLRPYDVFRGTDMSNWLHNNCINPIKYGHEKEPAN